MEIDHTVFNRFTTTLLKTVSIRDKYSTARSLEMPIIVTKTDVKPEDQSFRHSHETNGFTEATSEVQQEMLDHLDWCRAFPGVISRTGNAADDHTWVTTTIFESLEAYEIFKTAVESSPYAQKRIAFGKSIGIVSTTEVKEI